MKYENSRKQNEIICFHQRWLENCFWCFLGCFERSVHVSKNLYSMKARRFVKTIDFGEGFLTSCWNVWLVWKRPRFQTHQLRYKFISWNRFECFTFSSLGLPWAVGVRIYLTLSSLWLNNSSQIQVALKPFETIDLKLWFWKKTSGEKFNYSFPFSQWGKNRANFLAI